VVRGALSKCDFEGVPEGREKGFFLNPGGLRGFFFSPGVEKGSF
jgi:hypothetical protein